MDIVLSQDIQNTLGVLVPPGRIKTESYLFFIRFHAIDGQFPSIDGAGDGDGLGYEGRDALYKGGYTEEKEGGFNDLDAESRLKIFRFPEPFYPTLYEIGEIF